MSKKAFKKGRKKVSAVSDLQCLIWKWCPSFILEEEAAASIHPTLTVKCAHSCLFQIKGESIIVGQPLCG